MITARSPALATAVAHELLLHLAKRLTLPTLWITAGAVVARRL